VAVINTSALAIIFCALLASSVIDLKRRIIPDELVILVAVCGLCACLATRSSEVGLSLSIGAGVFFALVLCHRCNWLGGGDVKLISALSLVVPAHQVGTLMVEISVAGAILCCVYLTAGFALRTFRTKPAGETPLSTQGPFSGWVHLESERIMAGRSVPYALAILGGFAYHAFTEFAPCSHAIFCSF
jgi:prepilin peptidase CpaA